MLGVPGGFYRLCWGHDPGDVHNVDYNVELDGTMKLRGPLPHQALRGRFSHEQRGVVPEAVARGRGRVDRESSSLTDRFDSTVYSPARSVPQNIVALVPHKAESTRTPRRPGMRVAHTPSQHRGERRSARALRVSHATQFLTGPAPLPV